MILLISAWLTAMVFAQASIAEQLTPGTLSKDMWLGLLSIGAFGLSLVQLQVNWKARAQVYHQAATALSTFVKEVRPVLGSTDTAKIEAALAKYQVLTESLEPIPESEFVKLKKKHKVKVEISKHLDNYPGASITLFRLKLWYRDTFACPPPTFDSRNPPKP